MKRRLLIYLIILNSVNVFSQNIHIKKESDMIVAKMNKIISIPVRIDIPANNVFYNFSNYAELNSDREDLLNKILDGLVFQLYESSYVTQWEKGVRILNLRCLTSDTDTLRLKYDTRKKQVVKYNMYDNIYENRLYSHQADTSINSTIYFKTPEIKGDFNLYFIYGQDSLGKILSNKDTLIKNKNINVFEGLILSDTINIKIK